MNKIEELQKIYNSLPRLQCKKLCHESCGPLGMSKLEYDRIIKKTGKPPVFLKKQQCCSLLNRDKTCKVYGIRPFICRLFGLVEKMKCPHGCVPERWLSDEEAYALMDRIEKLSGDKNPVIVKVI